ncbi:MAG: hypothetical protein H7237_11365, partial [Alkalinema sp. FL-bin-369]|nr:hypothetical protein [Leptolyngbyaceae cyanobacterium LF-bin-369]
MTTNFSAQVYQNAYLPEGSREVNAIMTVVADGEEGTSVNSTEKVFGIICDTSGSMDGEKMVAAKSAIAKLIELLPEETYFFVVTGSSK